MLNAHNADVYTDFSGLAKLKSEARNKSPEAIEEVAKQFESVFLNMVMKSMRQAKLSDGILDSDQSAFYRDMYDQQLALHLSGEPGIGLAELIARQLSPKENSKEEQLSVEDYLNRSVATVTRFRAEKLDHAPIPDTKTAAPELNSKSIQPIINKEMFVKQLLPHAQQAAAELGIDAGVLLAQAALETGWGKSVIKLGDGKSSFNLFNIKADKTWHGEKVGKSTLEFSDGVARKEMAAFRSYGSYQESFDDYVRFIKNNPRYANAIKIADKPDQYMRELQKAGYATDPDYAAKVMRIFNGDTLRENGSVVALK